MHSIDLASAPAAISSALIVHSLQFQSLSPSPRERMASASSTEQVPMKIEPAGPEASGTRQGETEPGVFDLLPPIRRSVHVSIFSIEKGFTMEGEVDIRRTSLFK